MELQYGCRNFRSNRAAYHFFKNLGFIFAAYDNDNLFRFHDAADSHCVSLAGNIVLGLKETLVGLDRARSQVYAVGFAWEHIARLVEPDMAVVA